MTCGEVMVDRRSWSTPAGKLEDTTCVVTIEIVDETTETVFVR